MKRVLPWLSLIPALALVWQMFSYYDKKGESRRDQDRAKQEAILAHVAHTDTLVRVMQDSLLAYSIRQHLMDMDLATAESRVYRLRHPLPDSGGHP